MKIGQNSTRNPMAPSDLAYHAWFKSCASFFVVENLLFAVVFPPSKIFNPFFPTDHSGYISDVTVLLSLTVFLNQVSDSMPNTSDAVPLISMQNISELALAVFTVLLD